MGDGDCPVLLPEVLEVVKAVAGAPAREVAFAPFLAGGGLGAGAVGRGGEVGGEGAGLEGGAEARLAGGAQGLKALVGLTPFPAVRPWLGTCAWWRRRRIPGRLAILR